MEGDDRSSIFYSKTSKGSLFSFLFFQGGRTGNNPSYVWRSILAAKDLILKGSILKVRKSESINVWNDPWIPDANNKKVMIPIIHGLEEIKVSNLLMTDSSQWDHDLVRDIFNERDTQKILSIPISQTLTVDSCCWLQGERGIYEVKSGYGLLYNMYNQDAELVNRL